jgi:selenium metabolism protein YedF
MLEAGVDAVHVLADSEVSAENIARMAKTEGWSVATAKDSSGIRLEIAKPDRARPGRVEPATDSPSAAAPTPKICVLISSDLLGQGDEQLGRVLMRLFIKTIGRLRPRPRRLIFLNAGVRLTTAGSELIGELRALEQEQIEILSCGTCLDYYGLKDALQVGIVSNMFEIASILVDSDRVLSP